MMKLATVPIQLFPSPTYTFLKADFFQAFYPDKAPRLVFIVQTNEGSVIGRPGENDTTISIIATEN